MISRLRLKRDTENYSLKCEIEGDHQHKQYFTGIFFKTKINTKKFMTNQILKIWMETRLVSVPGCPIVGSEVKGKISKLNKILILSSFKILIFCSSWPVCIHLTFKGCCCNTLFSWVLSFWSLFILCSRWLPLLPPPGLSPECLSPLRPHLLPLSHVPLLQSQWLPCTPWNILDISYMRSFALESPLPEKLLP